MTDGLHKNATILVVDDDPFVRKLVFRLLSRVGYSCFQADSVASAEQVLAETDIDLVISDIKMPPGPSGLELVKSLQPKMPEVAVLMVTGNNEMQVAIQALELGAYGYVFKPFEKRSLLVQVSNALRRRYLELQMLRQEEILRERVREQTSQIRKAQEEIILRLTAAAEFRDNETGAHIRRLGLYAAEMGLLLGWDEVRRERIRLAAAMHDIGKIGIPDAILQKPGKLTAEEWTCMQTHASIGWDILKDAGIPLLDVAAEIAYCHHERWDGRGYPNGIRGEEIAIEARIISLVDIYDALSHKRCYKPAWPEEEVIAELKKEKGQRLDAELVDLFIDNMDIMRKVRQDNPDEDREGTREVSSG